MKASEGNLREFESHTFRVFVIEYQQLTDRRRKSERTMIRIQIRDRYMKTKIVLSVLACIILLVDAIYAVKEQRIVSTLAYLLFLGMWVRITRMAVQNWQLSKQIKIEENKRVTFSIKPTSNGHAVYTITNLNTGKSDQPMEEK